MSKASAAKIEEATKEIVQRIRDEFAPGGPQGLPSIAEILTRHFGESDEIANEE